MKVDVVLDIACAASYSGFTRFERAAERFRQEGGDLEVTFRPFQLVPDASTAGESLHEVHLRAFGPEVVAQTARAAALAKRDGIDLNYDRAVFTNTFDAHRLISVAAGQDKAEKMVERLFRAYFTDGLNVGDPDTLRRLADEVGVAWSDEGADGVRAELRRVREAGIRSVPLFVFEDGTTLSGAQTEATFAATMKGIAAGAAA